MFRKYILPRLVWYFYRIMYASWRITIVEPDELLQLKKEHKSFLLAHWHGDELAMVFMFRYFGMATMISTSRDGEIINYVATRFGGKTSRGSSTRGAATALKGLIKLCKAGNPTSIAVDGPKGPIHEVKPGIFEISRLTGAPIFAVGVYVDRKFVAYRSWNKAIFPKPFARIVITFSHYKTITRDMNAKSEIYAKELAELIHNTNQQAKEIYSR